MNINKLASYITNNKQLSIQILFAAVFTVLIIIIGANLVLRSPHNNTPSASPDNISVTNTIALSSNIKDDAKNIKLDSKIIFYFPQPLDDNSKKSINISKTPDFPSSRKWINNKTLVLSPIPSLKELQTYTIQVSSVFPSFTLRFTTGSFSILRAEETKSSGLSEDELRSRYPWLSNFPIITGKYTVYFDLQKETFNALLKLSRPEQKEPLKKSVMKNLDDLNIDTDKYKIEWQYENL